MLKWQKLIMRSMGDMPGAPGMQMSSRDQIQNGGFGTGDEDDEDDDDDDEEASEAPRGRGLIDQAQLAPGKLKSGAKCCELCRSPFE